MTDNVVAFKNAEVQTKCAAESPVQHSCLLGLLRLRSICVGLSFPRSSVADPSSSTWRHGRKWDHLR